MAVNASLTLQGGLVDKIVETDGKIPASVEETPAAATETVTVGTPG